LTISLRGLTTIISSAAPHAFADLPLRKTELLHQRVAGAGLLNWIENAALPHTARQGLQRRLVEVAPWLRKARLDRGDRQLSQLLIPLTLIYHWRRIIASPQCLY
jgi:hypothetical protein